MTFKKIDTFILEAEEEIDKNAVSEYTSSFNANTLSFQKVLKSKEILRCLNYSSEYMSNWTIQEKKHETVKYALKEKFTESFASG